MRTPFTGRSKKPKDATGLSSLTGPSIQLSNTSFERLRKGTAKVTPTFKATPAQPRLPKVPEKPKSDLHSDIDDRANKSHQLGEYPPLHKLQKLWEGTSLFLDGKHCVHVADQAIRELEKRDREVEQV